jgi:hypothetical protein
MSSWDLMCNWGLVLPPSRPSLAQLVRIKTLLDNINKKEPVAVLGSTPEFVDLLHECKFTAIYVIEKNMTFYNSVLNYRVYHNDETVIEGNWLEVLPKYNNIFSLILSDLTSGNIPYIKLKQFYRAISNALNTNGIFVDKVLTQTANKIPIDDIVNKYAKLPLNLLNINYFSCEMLFCSELLNINNEVDSTLFYSILEERITNARVKAFVKHSKQITPPGFKWYYGIVWDQLKKIYCPDLKVMSIVYEPKNSPYYKRVRYFTMIKGR